MLLIRDPAEVVASATSGRGRACEPDDIGLLQQERLAAYWSGRGTAAPVVDSADFLADPEAYLRWLCGRLGIGFTPAMLRWPAGPRDSDGARAPHWYAAVRASTGFEPPRRRRRRSARSTPRSPRRAGRRTRRCGSGGCGCDGLPGVTLRSFVALGDSFTEGLEDDLGPDGRHLGWADRVAAALATHEGGLRYANLAVRGKVLDEVVDEQLPVALALRRTWCPSTPARTTCSGRGRDVAAVVARYDAAVGRLAAAGVQVLLFTVIERAGGTGRTAARLAERFARFNVGVRRTAERTGAPGRRRRRRAGAAGPAAVARGPAAPGAGRPRAGGGRRPGDARRRPTRTCSAARPAGGGSRCRPGRARAAGADVLADVRWVRRYLAPWVGRRLRGVSSGDGLSAKHLELVDGRARRGGG